jgi:antitoxin component YwqK of YwqJK toxin-antitoxin module
MKYLKLITMKNGSVLTSLLFFVSILMSCESPIEEIVTKDDEGNIESKYTIRKKDGQKHGFYTLYYDSKLSEEGVFADNKQEGFRTIFYPNGKVQVEEVYSNNNLISKKDYYESGNLKSEGQYDEAVTMSGEWKYYYENGKLKESVHFKSSVEDGAFKEYYENGNLKTEGTFIPVNFGVETEGLEQGELKEYNERGELIRKKECEAGRCKTTWEQNME